MVQEDAGGTELTVCLLGSTGVGKSSSCNTLIGCRSDDVFPVGHGTATTTCSPQVTVLPWRGHGPSVCCVDLPGSAIAAGRDGELDAGVVQLLRGVVRHVHVFLVLFSSQSPRFDVRSREMLTRCRDMLGKDFLRHVMVGFTRWEFQPAARRRRERTGHTEAWKVAEINRELRAFLGHDFDCPCVFLDNSLNSWRDEALKEEFQEDLPALLGAMEDELQKLRIFAESQQPFLCRGLQAERPQLPSTQWASKPTSLARPEPSSVTPARAGGDPWRVALQRRRHAQRGTMACDPKAHQPQRQPQQRRPSWDHGLDSWAEALACCMKAEMAS
mmetsp:Transcript_20472/g.46671  ORF Transcript_20472/g.46671 Transcript_20472/m.46671 type:complete len:329 (+) Transcript_20472:46-1032(+)